MAFCDVEELGAQGSEAPAPAVGLGALRGRNTPAPQGMYVYRVTMITAGRDARLSGVRGGECGVSVDLQQRDGARLHVEVRHMPVRAHVHV